VVTVINYVDIIRSLNGVSTLQDCPDTCCSSTPFEPQSAVWPTPPELGSSVSAYEYSKTRVLLFTLYTCSKW